MKESGLVKGSGLKSQRLWFSGGSLFEHPVDGYFFLISLRVGNSDFQGCFSVRRRGLMCNLLDLKGFWHVSNRAKEIRVS